MSANILVTGATGSVGREVVKQLVEKGARPRAATRDVSKPVGDGAEPVAFDYDSNDSIDRALAGVERLFLVTPPLHEKEAEYGHLLVERAKAAGVKHIVKLSAYGVEGAPESPHRRVELALEGSGVPFTHLRPNFFNQNFVNFSAQSIKQEGKFYIAGADGKVSYVDTRDVGAVGAEVLLNPDKHAGAAYTLTGGAALDHHAIARIFSDVLGRTITYVPIDDEAFRSSLRSFGASDHFVEGMSFLYGIIRNGWAGNITQEIENVLGRKPITFEQFARDVADQLKA